MAAPKKFDTVQEFVKMIPPKLVTLNPSQSIIFDLINLTQQNSYLHTKYLRFAVFDSPIKPTTNTVAAMIVPIHREADWIFSTQEGHKQILFDNHRFSRLVLISNTSTSKCPANYVLDRFPLIDYVQRESLENSLRPAVTMLCHLEAFDFSSTNIEFVTYNKDDDVICRFVQQQDGGIVVGPMSIEIVGVKLNDNDIEFRRRLRFKKTLDVIQSELRVVPNPPIQNITSSLTQEHEFIPNTGVIYQPYLTAMVAGLCSTASFLDERFRSGIKPRALCVGVGGGALLSFLNATLGFDVVGLEVSLEVLQVASQLFGLKCNENIRLIVGNAIKVIEELGRQRPKLFIQPPYDIVELDLDCQNLIPVKELDVMFDVIMVDLFTFCVPVIAPPPEFMEKSVLEASKSVLSEGGILVINVVRRLDDQSSYDSLVQSLRKLFHAVYKNVVEDDEGNVVLIATTLSKKPVIYEREDSFSTRLRALFSEEYLKKSLKRI